MPYQQLKCPKGHTFRAYVAGRYSKVECPTCRSQHVPAASSYVPPDSYSFPVTQCDTSPAWGSSSFDSGSSTSSDTFSSGGGGDFGGGGSSGDW